MGFDSAAVIVPVVSVGTIPSDDLTVSRREDEFVGWADSWGIQTQAPYKAKATTPRISRSVILRAIDRCGRCRTCSTLGSTAMIESAGVSPGSSGTMGGAAASTIEATGVALTVSLAGVKFSIEHAPSNYNRIKLSPNRRTAVGGFSAPFVDCSELGLSHVNKMRAGIANWI